MNFKLLAVSALIAAGTSTAQAGQFYIDNGVDFAPDTTVPTKVNATSTALKNQITLKYESTTDIFFSDPNVGLQVGDTIVTSGGLAVGDISENIITSLNPSQVGPFGSADNGFGTDWNISFTFNDLEGTVNGFVGGFPTLSYTGGTIEMLYTTDFGVTYNNFMDLEVQSSSLVGGANLGLEGLVDFTNVDPGFNDLFRLPDGTSFYDAWQQVPPLEILFVVDQNTDPNAAVITDLFDDEGNIVGITIASNHDGSLAFQAVPEPSTVALLGLGLLGFGARLRKKAA